MPIRDWVSVVVSCLSLFCVFQVHIFTFELDASAFILSGLKSIMMKTLRRKV